MTISIIEIDGSSHPLGASAANVAFDGTGAGIEAGTVQDAIEEVSVLAAEGSGVGVVDNLETADGQKALSAGMGKKLDEKASVVFNHMHWAAGSSSPSVNVGSHERYFCPENHTIYHFYGRIYASEPTTTTLTYQPSKEVVYYDLETATAWRWNGENMVLATYPPYYAIATSSNEGTIDGYNPQYVSDIYPRLVWFSVLRKLAWFYLDGSVRRYIAFDPDPNRVYVRLGTSPKLQRWNGTQWVDVGQAIDTSTLQPRLTAGTGIAINSNNQISVETGAVAAGVDLPVSGGDVFQALQGITAGQTVVINSDGANIVDNHTSHSILTAPSSRQMAMVAQNIDALFSKINDLFDKLAGIAFIDTKPQSSWKANADWLTPAIPQHTITVGTMTGVSAAIDGTAINNSTDADEGQVTIALTPDAGKTLTDNNISIKMGNDDVAFTRVDENGSAMVTFILYGNVTISASAVSGIGVQKSGNNFDISTNNIPLSGNGRVIVLSHQEHYSWDGGVSLSVNGVPLVVDTDYTIQINSNNDQKTITILKVFDSDAYPIVVTANAVENAKLTFTWDAEMTATKNGNPATSGFTVYSDEVSVQSPCVIKFTPAVGKKWAENGTPSATGQTFIQDGNSYKLEISSVPSTDNVTVSATVEDVPMRTITLPTIGNGIESVELQDLDGNTIEADEDIYSVPEGSGVKIVAIPSTFYRLSVDSENSSMGNEQGDWYSESEESDYTLTTTITEVTGNVILTLSKTNYNDDYKGLRYVSVSWQGTNSGSGIIFVFGPYGTNTNNCSYFLSKLIDIREINSVQFHCASNADSDLSLRLYRSDFSYAGAYSYNAVDRIVSRDAASYPIPSDCAYCRLFTTGENAATAWIKTGANSESLEPAWQGGNDVVSNAKTYTNFIASPFAVLAQVQGRTLPLLESDEDGIINNIYRVSGNGDSINVRQYYSRNAAGACWGRMTTGGVMNNKAVSLSPVIDLPNPSGTLKLKLAAGTLSDGSGCRPQMMFYVPSSTNDMTPSECNEITSVGMEKEVYNAYKGGSLRLMFERGAYDRGEVYVKDITDANNEVQLWPPVSNEE